MNNILYVTNEDGVEIKYAILFTFNSEEYEKDYVVYYEEGKDELYVSSYESDNEDSGVLGIIEDDEEWEMIEEVIEAFLMEDDVEEA